METLEIDEGFTVSAFVDWNPLKIIMVMLQREDGKQIHFQAFLNDEKYKHFWQEKWDTKKMLIKFILHDNWLYTLDLEGTVSYHIGGMPAMRLREIMQHCTDIFVNDRLYAKQSTLSEQGQLVNQVIKKVGEEVEI